MSIYRVGEDVGKRLCGGDDMVDFGWHPTLPNWGGDVFGTIYLTVYGNIASSDVTKISEVPNSIHMPPVVFLSSCCIHLYM